MPVARCLRDVRGRLLSLMYLRKSGYLGRSASSHVGRGVPANELEWGALGFARFGDDDGDR